MELIAIRKRWDAAEEKLFGILGITRQDLYCEIKDMPLTDEEMKTINDSISEMRWLLIEFIKLASERIMRFLKATMVPQA